MSDEVYYWRHTVPTDKLRRMLEAERRRALGAHWAYDLARHAAMLRVYKERLATEHAPAKSSDA